MVAFMPNWHLHRDESIVHPLLRKKSGPTVLSITSRLKVGSLNEYRGVGGCRFPTAIQWAAPEFSACYSGYHRGRR